MKKISQITITEEQGLLLCSVLGEHIHSRTRESFVRKEEAGEIISSPAGPDSDPSGTKKMRTLQRLIINAMKNPKVCLACYSQRRLDDKKIQKCKICHGTGEIKG